MLQNLNYLFLPTNCINKNLSPTASWDFPKRYMISRNSLHQAIKTKQQHCNLAVLECHQRVQPKRREPLNAIGWARNAFLVLKVVGDACSGLVVSACAQWTLCRVRDLAGSIVVFLTLTVPLESFHPFTAKISFVILLTICHSILVMLVWRIRSWIK